MLQGTLQPRTTVQAPYRWAEDDKWRDVFMHLSQENRTLLKKAGEERRKAQANVKNG